MGRKPASVETRSCRPSFTTWHVSWKWFFFWAMNASSRLLKLKPLSALTCKKGNLDPAVSHCSISCSCPCSCPCSFSCPCYFSCPWPGPVDQGLPPPQYLEHRSGKFCSTLAEGLAPFPGLEGDEPDHLLRLPARPLALGLDGGHLLATPQLVLTPPLFHRGPRAGQGGNWGEGWGLHQRLLVFQFWLKQCMLFLTWR